MQRWQRLDVDHDIHDLAGYNWAGTVRFLDRDFFRALVDPAYAQQIGLGPIDTGMSVEDTVDCLMTHEAVEKVLLDADNAVDTYLPAHELATCAEHQAVRKKGGSPRKYEDGLEKAIQFCIKKTPANPPLDLSCSPLLDEPDADDKRVLPILRQLGVHDADKVSKESVGYSKATGAKQCRRCAHWQNEPMEGQFGLGRCEIVCGLVRANRWCQKWSEANGEELDQGGNEEQRRPAP